MNITTPDYGPAFDADSQVQPASIDLRVDRVYWKRQRVRFPIDLTNKLSTRMSSRRTYKQELGGSGKFRLGPGEIIMARTLEEFTVPPGYSAEIFTRSSFGRLGLLITCAGYINPGYRGRMPLQIKNLGKDRVYLKPFTAVCQLVIKQLSSPPQRAYDRVPGRGV
jgi:dCTP deaminase